VFAVSLLPGPVGGYFGRMETGRDVLAETTENPAAVADAEQHTRQELAGIRARAVGYLRPLAVAAGIVVSGWLIQRWRRRR
jgi:hypothetical protein